MRFAALAVCCGLLFAAAPAVVADPLAGLLGEADADYAALRRAVQTSRQRLGELARALDEGEAAVIGDAAVPPDQRTEWRRRSSAIRTALQERSGSFARFETYAELVAQATDAADAIADFHEGLRADALVEQLRPLVADTAGRPNVAALDAATAAFAAARLELASVSDRLRRRLEILREQAELRSAAYGGEQDPRYRQAVAQYGADFAAASSFRPSTPREVFRASADGRASDGALIWDEQAGEWYRLKGDVPVETIFQEAYSALGRRPTPGQLKFLAENYGRVTPREATAAAVANYVGTSAREQPVLVETFAKVDDGDKLSTAVGDADMFRKKFVYDGQFRAWTLEVLDKLRRGLSGRGGAAQSVLRELDALMAGHGITLESQWDEGVVPRTATVRVVAWFSDRPKSKFNSVWRFDKETVTIGINEGHGYGVRAGNVVRSEGSLPGHNCTAADVRTFKPGGKLSFEATYTCALDDGATQVSKVSGAGTWQLVAPKPAQRGKAKR